MACAGSLLLSEEQFLCSVCLEVFTDPITTPCGHNYCNACITHYWDTKDVCQCPLCNEAFDKRPKFSVNRVLSEMADQFRKSKQQVKENNSNSNREPGAEASDEVVSCDFCTETKKLKAVKSCLVCLASYCDAHLEPHQRVASFKRHKLIDPVKNLEDILCKKHDRPLELFCKTDHVCVCRFCTESDHKLHQIASLKEAYEEKKAELGMIEAEVEQMIQVRELKIQEVKHSGKLGREDADREIADSVRVFTALLGCIERSQAEVIHAIEEKQKTTEKQAEGFVEDLQREITELKKRGSELRLLSRTEDHLHLLQNATSINTPPPPGTKDWTNINVRQPPYVGTVRTAVDQLEKTLSQEMEKLCDAELRRIQRYAVDITLDPDTAHPILILSEDGKQVSCGNAIKNLPDNKERFSESLCLLGKQSFSSERFYYEVQVNGKTGWCLGVARESTNRKGTISVSPNNGYWTVSLINGNEYFAVAAGPPVLLPVKQKVQKVGVFVDYEEGVVSFYDVEARVHLYSFTGCSFTEKLHPVFSPHNNDGGKNSAPLIISPVIHTD